MTHNHPPTKTKNVSGKQHIIQHFHQVLRCIFWVLFCTTEGEELNFDDVEQRWRLLLWTLVISLLWNSTRHNWGIFAPILLLISFVKVSVICARTSLKKRTAHCWQIPACLALLGAVSAVTTSSSYSVLASLTQKLAVKEYNLWCHWCPDTHVTILSVIAITCAVQGVFRLPLASPWIRYSPSILSPSTEVVPTGDILKLPAAKPQRSQDPSRVNRKHKA
ncbi:hypothetical protein RRG08_029535 [Elysia crispata]|uniref:Uncharacterized protein n=1 Tax=Elysia crispata TaxID=231223 RepID=A0AAE0XVX6_9GAST|nr:hypothetical protein RRG08_029535 [Elysia crispata]